MAASANSSVPITELFWSLLDKADRKFSNVREVPSFARHRSDADFHKAFRIYTQLWKLQQENRQKLVDAGLKRWEVGEIASRIAQLYYGQYQRTSDSGYLSEAFVFYEAILSREYFKGDGSGGGGQEQGLVNKQLRFLARFLIVSLVIGKREIATRLANLLKGLVDENKKSFQEAEYKEWKHVVQDTVRFLRADSPFMNMRPLRYSFAYDSHPDSLTSVVSCNDKRNLVLHDALLSSYYHDEVLSMMCEELPPDGILLMYLAASGEFGVQHPTTLSSGSVQDSSKKTLGRSDHETNSSENSPTNSQDELSSHVTKHQRSIHEGCLWLGFRGSKGSNYLYPCDLIPFTRKPLFLVIDSNNSHAFKEDLKPNSFLAF